jgi:hypothetical protein
MSSWSDFRDKVTDSVVESVSTYVDIFTGEKDLGDITDDDFMDPGSAIIEAITGVNVNAFAGFGSENDFFEKPWTDREIDWVGSIFPGVQAAKLINGEVSKEDLTNPGSTFWNPAGQIADPGNFFDMESVEAWADAEPESRDVISAIVAAGVASGVVSGASAAEAGFEAGSVEAGTGLVATGSEVTLGEGVLTGLTETGVNLIAGAELGDLATGITVAAALYQAQTAYEAAGDAEAAAKTAAELEALYTAEQVETLEQENIQTLSTARARAAASGVSGASSEIYINALKEAGEEDVQWLKDVGISNYNLAIQEGESAVAQAEAQMWGYVGQGLGGVLEFFS